jgi:hypothetical protein
MRAKRGHTSNGLRHVDTSPTTRAVQPYHVYSRACCDGEDRLEFRRYLRPWPYALRLLFVCFVRSAVVEIMQEKQKGEPTMTCSSHSS